MDKKHAQEICECIGIQLEKDNIEATAKIMKMCRGLSAIDDYWIAEDNKVQKAENQRWENVNLRTNPLNKTLAYIALYYKTIVMDYLCSNRDRHTSNWGFYMNNKTGDIVDIHLLYDHNNAFYEKFMKDPSKEECKMVNGGITLKKMATKIMTDPKLRKMCDLRCIKAVTRDMFITSDSDKDKAMGDVMYQSFMSRAVELGLYKKRKLSIAESIKAAKGDYVVQYEPVSIEKDNTQKSQSLRKYINTSPLTNHPASPIM